jgi:hypothetical protein
MQHRTLEGGALGAPPSASVAASLNTQRPGAFPSSGPLFFCLGLGVESEATQRLSARSVYSSRASARSERPLARSVRSSKRGRQRRERAAATTSKSWKTRSTGQLPPPPNAKAGEAGARPFNKTPESPQPCDAPLTKNQTEAGARPFNKTPESPQPCDAPLTKNQTEAGARPLTKRQSRRHFLARRTQNKTQDRPNPTARRTKNQT